MSLSAVGERADLDYDEVVGFGDFGVMTREWGYDTPAGGGGQGAPASAGQGPPYIGDLDRDGVVGLADLVILCERWW